MKGKLNIIHILRRISFEEWGGTETVVWNICKALISRGHTSDIVSTAALSKPGKETVDKIDIHRFTYFYPYLFLTKKNKDILDKKGGNPYSPEMYNYLKKLSGVNLLHCHTMQRTANQVRLISQKRKIPYIITFHGGQYNVPDSEISTMTKPLKGTFNYGKVADILLKNRKFIDDADGIICVGYDEYLESKKHYPDKNILYLPNGTDPDRFDGIDGAGFREKYNIDENKKIILNVSRIDHQKNQKILIKLMVKNNCDAGKEKYHLVLIGPPTSHQYYTEIKEEIKSKNLNNNITVIPGLPPHSKELLEAYKSADVFILPSKHEPFGIVALEAWSAGVPVIAAKVGGLQYLIENNKTGLFIDNESVESIEQGIKRVLNEPELISNLINNGKQEVNEKYSWEKVTDKLEEFYEKVINDYHKK